jgi:hypothetical protein
MEYVRVSDILAQLQSFDHIDPKVLEAKAQLGTNVHEAIGEFVQGDFPILESEKAVGYFRSYEEWHRASQPQYQRMEQRLFDDTLMITGQMDAIVTINDKPNMLIDFKCSYQPNPEIWALQAHFYNYLCKVNGIEVHPQMIWINLQKTGKFPKLICIDYSEFTMQRCIDMANKFWEDRANAKDVE